LGGCPLMFCDFNLGNKVASTEEVFLGTERKILNVYTRKRREVSQAISN